MLGVVLPRGNIFFLGIYSWKDRQIPRSLIGLHCNNGLLTCRPDPAPDTKSPAPASTPYPHIPADQETTQNLSASFVTTSDPT